MTLPPVIKSGSPNLISSSSWSDHLNQHASVAIVGMGCMFPQASTLQQFWKNIVSRVDALHLLPEHRLPSQELNPYFSKSQRGGRIDDFAWFDALRFKVMPITVSGTEPDQLLALQTAAYALDDARYSYAPSTRQRTQVILGRGGYIGPGMTNLNLSLIHI